MTSSPGVPRAIADDLARRGLSADDPLRALDALASSWGASPATEAAVVALVAASDAPDAGERLAALAPRTTDRSVKREIKRALYKLEQRGRWTPPAPPPPPDPQKLLGPAEDEPEAWLSAIDPSGSRLLWMARRTGSEMASLSALVNEDAGLQELYAGATNRKALRHAQRELAERNGVQLVEAPWAHVDALLVRATELANDPARSSEVARARREIVPRPATGTPRPPVDALVDRAAAARDADALAASARALAEKELAGWLLPRDWIEPALAAIDEAQSSVLIVSPQQREERVHAAVENAAEQALAPPERRERFAARFDETAYLLARRGKLDVARSLVAAAEATRAGRPVREVPILEQLAARSLALAAQLRAEQARDEARSSLIVTPQQALAEQRAALRRGR